MTPRTAQEFSFAPVPQQHLRSTMDNYLELPIGDKAPEVVTTVVEIPQDSVNKYEYDQNLRVFVLDRVLHSPVHFPGDYGFVSQTIAQDGDPLDILILGDTPTFPGCIYPSRPIGLFEMLDHGTCDEKIIAYATGNPRFADIEDYTGVQPHVLREVEHFFSVYKDLEDTETKVLGWKGREAAYEVIRLSHERFVNGTVAK
ncbi:MAG: inorganic diphosphatase [Terriglobia bacterium]